MDSYYSGVIERVNQVLVENGFETEQARAKVLSELCNAPLRRTMTWVRGQHFPRGTTAWAEMLSQLSDRFDVSWDWLATGQGIMDAESIRFARSVSQLPEDKQKLIRRIIDRLRRDPDFVNVVDSFNRREITHDQLVAALGAERQS